jgi:hypothetical protein
MVFVGFKDSSNLVQDTHPPILNVTLTPTQLWPANHKLVRIDAMVMATRQATFRELISARLIVVFT